MKHFNVMMTTTSERQFEVIAETQEQAAEIVSYIVEHTNLLDGNAVITNHTKTVFKEQCGGVCELCSNYCELCGTCGLKENHCEYPDEACEDRCHFCGTCLAEDD